jgi:hypothetical protein
VFEERRISSGQRQSSKTDEKTGLVLCE